MLTKQISTNKTNINKQRKYNQNKTLTKQKINKTKQSKR